jgi:hypothetical protein
MPISKKNKPKLSAAKVVKTKATKPAKAAPKVAKAAAKTARAPAKSAKSAAKSTAKTGGKSKAGAAGKDEKGKRKLGLRGAAPWAARHAAKHAEEARARASQPALPGSARATIRTPSGAEDIKQKIGALNNCLAQIKGLRKALHKTFFDIGLVLRDIQARKLFEPKGYGTFDAVLDREIDLGKTTSQRLVRITQVFIKEAALDFGMERCINGLMTLEAVPEAAGSSVRLDSGKIPPAPISTTMLPLRPPGR